MKKNKKVLLIIEISLLVLVVATFVFCLIAQLTNPEAPYAIWVKENIWDVEKSLADFKAHVPTLIKSLITIVIIYAVCRILRMIFKAKMQKNNRTKTVFDLLDGFVKYGCAIAIILTVLTAFGVDTTALIASVGVLTLVVGLGAQPLIEDIIAGIFIIFENEYNVGEIISINDFRGTVIEIGIRSTKLLDSAGNIKIINNSNVGDVVNLSRENSLAVVDCDFPYDVPLEVLENALEKNFEKLKHSIPAIIEGPYYKGVCAYKDSNVTVKIVATCKEEDRFQVERDLNREYRKIITALGIDIAFPQVVINYPTEKQEFNPSKRKAENFVDKQEELSRGLEEQQQ